MYVVLHVIGVMSRCARAGRGYDARPRGTPCSNLPLQTPDQRRNAADELMGAIFSFRVNKKSKKTGAARTHTGIVVEALFNF